MTDDSARIAVLIDADNTSAKPLKEMLEELTSYGTLTVKRAYGDWSSSHLNGWREVLLSNAISPHQQFAYTVGKNATDSALIIDAMDLLYSGNVEGFALVSSDSDFTPLATRLRESGKRVIGVGRRTTPKAFVEACERFVFLELLTSEGNEAPLAEPPRDPTSQEPKDPTTASVQRPLQSLLTRALNRVDTDDEAWARLSALGSHLNRTDPSFDSRNYGFDKLSDLVKAQPYVETKTVTAPGGSEQLWVRPKGRKAVTKAASPKKTTKKSAKKSAKTPSKTAEKA